MNYKDKVINIIQNSNGFTINEIADELSISNNLQKQKLILFIKSLQKELNIKKKNNRYYILKNNEIVKKKCIDELKTLNWSVYSIINNYLDLQEKNKIFFDKLDNEIEQLVEQTDQINTKIIPLLN